MYYKELLSVRKRFLVFVGIITCIALVIIIVASTGHMNVDTGMTAPAHLAAASQSDNQVPLAAFFAFASLAAAIFATILGISLSCENDGHLEVAWTKPTSRVGYAARLFAVDIVGILAAFAFTLLASLGIMYVLGLGRHIAVQNDSWAELLRFLAYPLAWFGLAQGLTASVRGRAGAFVGFAWPIGFILIALYEAPLTPALHAITRVLNFVNPIAWSSVSVTNGATSELINTNLAEPTGVLVATSALMAVAIVGMTAALMQWRRLEA